jgi:TolB-like protein/Tfp pilus assembly protein PilF
VEKIRYFINEVARRRVLATTALYVVAAWATIQVADLAIEADLLRWTLRNVFVAAFLGFPVAMIVAWFYDITRKGLVRTPPLGAAATFDRSLSRRDYVVLASLGAIWALANIIVYSPVPIDRSIAILPFENRGHDPQGADLAFGVRLDLQTQLETLHDVKVIAHTSVENVDKNLPVAVIGQQLGAAFIMKGTVERVLDRVRVSVTLIDAKRNEQTWSGSWDRELNLTSLFDIRDDIATAITASLRTTLSPQDIERIQVRPTDNFAAHQAFLLGKQRMARRATGSLADAIDYFQQAIDLDPNFAQAWVGLAESSYLYMLYSSLPKEEWIPKIEAASNRARELDRLSGEAYAISAVVQSMGYGNDAAAEKAFRRALELNPNYATAHQWYGSFLVGNGRLEEGLIHKKKALELDPLSANTNLVVGMSLEGLGRFDEAMTHFKKAIEIDPELPGSYERISEIYRYVYGQMDEAVAWQRKGVARDPDEPLGSIYLGFIYLDLGDPTEAERWFNRSPFVDLLMEAVFLHRGEYAKSVDIAKETIQWQPDAQYTLANLRNHDLRAGRYAEARTRYGQGYPALLNEDEPVIGIWNYEVAIDLALVLTKTGEQDRADLLLERSLAYTRTVPRLGVNGYGISDVLIHALQGQSDTALAALRQAVDQGWRADWWLYLEHDPNLESIRSRPEFQAILKEIQADMAAQLARVREKDAAGELEPVPEPD